MIQYLHPDGKKNCEKIKNKIVAVNKVNKNEVNLANLFPKMQLKRPKRINNPEKMKEAGIIYACDQIIDLISNGVSHIHVYSMNKPDIAAGIMRNLSTIIK